MQKITAGFLKLLMREFFRRQANTDLDLAKETDRLAMLWDTIDFCMKLLKAECEVNQRRDEIQMLHDLANDDGYISLKPQTGS